MPNISTRHGWLVLGYLLSLTTKFKILLIIPTMYVINTILLAHIAKKFANVIHFDIVQGNIGEGYEKASST